MRLGVRTFFGLCSILISVFFIQISDAQTILDSTFGTNGTVRAFINGGIGFDNCTCVAVQSDGKVVVAGRTEVAALNWKFAVARFDTSGSLDNTFGTSGTACNYINGGNNTDDECGGVAIQSDGKIVLAGFTYLSSGTGTAFAVARYNTNGTLDAGFGTSGTAMTHITGGFGDEGMAVAIQSDGKIVVAGFSTPDGLHSYFALARFTTSGGLDNSFGASGTVSTSLTGGGDHAYSLAIQPDGKIVAVGTSGGDFGVVRYNTDGTLDTGFGTGGIFSNAVHGSNGGNDKAYSVALQSDGKIVAAGWSIGPSGISFAVARYDTSGALDSTFATYGTVTNHISGGGNDHGDAVSVQPDGKIVVAGISYDNQSHAGFGIERLNSDGTPDNTFGTNGSSRNSIYASDSTNDYGSCVALQSNGKIVVAGSSEGHPSGYNNAFAVARYLSQDVPLAVEASDFHAFAAPGSVTIEWRTQSELDNLGFNVYRHDNETGVSLLIASYESDAGLRGLGTSTVSTNYSYKDTHISAGHAYEYTVESVASDGSRKKYSPLQVLAALPQVFELDQNYPNPFNPSTTLRYSLPTRSRVRLVVYNVLGQIVADLVNTEQATGWNQVVWNANVSSGLYFYRLEAVSVTDANKRFVDVKEMVLLK